MHVGTYTYLSVKAWDCSSKHSNDSLRYRGQHEYRAALKVWCLFLVLCLFLLITLYTFMHGCSLLFWCSIKSCQSFVKKECRPTSLLKVVVMWTEPLRSGLRSGARPQKYRNAVKIPIPNRSDASGPRYSFEKCVAENAMQFCSVFLNFY